MTGKIRGKRAQFLIIDDVEEPKAGSIHIFPLSAHPDRPHPTHPDGKPMSAREQIMAMRRNIQSMQSMERPE